MKLISLNTWGGKIYKPLMDFIKQNSQTTDIFCFQEVYNTTSNIKQYRDIRANLLDELITILPDFQSSYSIEIRGFDSIPDPVKFDLTVGKALFIKNNIKVQDKGDILLYGNRSEKLLKNDFSNLPVTLQYINLVIQNEPLLVCNIHGTAFPGSKLDTDLRLEHSKKLSKFLRAQQGIKIVAGDFNLLPQTQSIKILEKDMRNLIQEFNIPKTRSNLSPYYKKPDFQKFADYVFVSKEINVKDFEVPDIEISDHLPLILEFEVC